MIFNKNNNGSKELRELTGSYFASNDFAKIKADIIAATEEICRIIGIPLYKKIDDDYNSETGISDDNKDLLYKIQRPIAILASLRMYQKNDLSHEDSGRKFKIDSDNEKLPWEWQLNRDDELQMDEYYRAVDSLIRYLNDKKPGEWTDSRLYKLSQLMLIKNAQDFEEYFPINSSERLYMLLVPFIKEAQMIHVKKAFGPTGWDDLLIQDSDSSETKYAACKALSLYAMSLALQRMPIQLFPFGTLKKYIKEMGAMNSEPASLNDIKIISEWIESDAEIWINQMKKAKNNSTDEYQLLPVNDSNKKYCKL